MPRGIAMALIFSVEADPLTAHFSEHEEAEGEALQMDDDHLSIVSP